MDRLLLLVFALLWMLVSFSCQGLELREKRKNSDTYKVHDDDSQSNLSDILKHKAKLAKEKVKGTAKKAKDMAKNFITKKRKKNNKGGALEPDETPTTTTTVKQRKKTRTARSDRSLPPPPSSSPPTRATKRRAPLPPTTSSTAPRAPPPPPPLPPPGGPSAPSSLLPTEPPNKRPTDKELQKVNLKSLAPDSRVTGVDYLNDMAKGVYGGYENHQKRIEERVKEKDRERLQQHESTEIGDSEWED